MISIKILGPGCPKCRNLETKVKNFISTNNIDAEVTKVEDIQEMMNYGIMMTPGLVVNEKVVSFGVIPKDEQLKKWFGDV